MSEEHALLSASGSHKWLNCTPSARLEAQFEDTPSEYAIEGTMAHKVAELKLKNYFGQISKDDYKSSMEGIQKDKNYNREMMLHASNYLDYIKEKALQNKAKPYVCVECKIDYSEFAPDGFGTADFVMAICDTLYVVDYKYGKGVQVSAENNSQMMLYALGAYRKVMTLYPIKQVVMCIFQPRLGSISEHTMIISDLLDWGEKVVKPKAKLAYDGLGDYNPGEHCRFCKAKAQCTARKKHAEASIGYAEMVKVSNITTWQDLGAMLKTVEWVEDYLKDVRCGLLDAILKGEEVPGWKVVEGRSNRIITDVDKAFGVLRLSGVDEALLYERKPITLTELEKLVTKSKVAEYIGKFIEKPKGKPTLVDSGDKRESYTKNSAVEDFKNIINESEDN